MIAAHDLRKRYGGHVVLDGVSLTVGAGQCLAVLGPNGAGKTTLLRILATLLAPFGVEAALAVAQSLSWQGVLIGSGLFAGAAAWVAGARFARVEAVPRRGMR